MRGGFMKGLASLQALLAGLFYSLFFMIPVSV